MVSNIIGIVGPLACGKGVVTEYLIKKYGYVPFSLSSIVHDEVKKRGITSFTRTTLQDIGDEMRKEEGDDVLAKRAIERLKDTKIIIEGIRNPGEVAYLRTIPGFFLIAVDSRQELRYQRVLKRGKPWDPKDWETFLKVDGRDSRDGEHTNGQQVRKCMQLADVQLQNEGNLAQFHEIVEKTLSSYGNMIVSSARS